MSIKVAGYDGNNFDQRSIAEAQRFLRTVYRLVFSGNYSTGGDTVDFTNGGVASAVPSAQSSNTPVAVRVISNGPLLSVGANGGNYDFIRGTTLANNLLIIYATAGTQYSAGAYGTDVTTDVVYIECLWPR